MDTPYMLSGDNEDVRSRNLSPNLITMDSRENLHFQASHEIISSPMLYIKSYPPSEKRMKL